MLADVSLTDYGILGTAVVVLAGTIATVARIVYVRVLGEPNGILTVIAARHIKFIDDLELSQKQITHTQLQVADGLVRLYRAQKQMAEALERLGMGDDAGAREKIEAAKQTLQNHIDKSQ